VVLWLLGPADEDSAVAVQPGVTRLGDPPPGLEAGVTGFEIDLFSASADVWLEALGEHQFADVGVVVAAVKTQPLWLLAGGGRACDRDRGERGF
jgi:hypothetical protein